MNLDELQSAQSRERQTDSLQPLPGSFYADAGAFVRQLREERERAAAAADDPFDSPEVRQLTDDIKTAERTVEAIYERRVGKLVKMASLAAADMPTSEEGLTAEERDLYERLVDAIEENRAGVLSAFDGEAETAGDTEGDRRVTDPSAAPSRGEPPTESTGSDVTDPTRDESTASQDSPPARSDAPATDDGDPDGRPAAGLSSDPTEVHPSTGGGRGGSGSPESETSAGGSPASADRSMEASRDDVDRLTVRITRDVGEIFGVDERTYTLSREDVVALPAENATPLLERDAAEQLDKPE